MLVITPVNYTSVLNALKEKIRQAKVRAVLSVNSELLATYWEIGYTILKQQNEREWGSKIIDRLSIDLKLEFPEMNGFSIRNLKYMRAFAEAYPHFPNVQASLAQSKYTNSNPEDILIVQAPLAQLSWYHHITLITKIKNPDIRLFYVNKTIENGWSRDVMVHQIESSLHTRQGALTTNFKTTIPVHQSEILQHVFKDPYYFDFLNLTVEAKEKDLENALIHFITKLLLELGDGFAFKGRQFSLEADGQTYFLDLLFYHTKLRRHIVIELKIGDFIPEFAGKMNFYLGLVDDRLKGKYDEPSIGLILCKTKSKVIAEYALRDTAKPIGIAEYKLSEKLPDDIKGELPSIEEIEQKLDEELKEKLDSSNSRLNLIKDKLKTIHGDEIQTPVTHSILTELYTRQLRPFYQQLIEKLAEFDDIFYNKTYSWNSHNKALVNFEQLDEFWKDEGQIKQISMFNFHHSLWGFRKDGTRDFDDSFQLILHIHTYWYGFSLSNFNNNQPVIKKLYHQELSTDEKQLIISTIANRVLDKVEWIINEIKGNSNM